ncbi:MAG: hypothetical protein KDB22_07295 [Planctomycetales bacterium]|nr:hypothetical protein [Planctomycetales bacterium]
MSDLLKTDQLSGLIAIRESPNDWFERCTRKLQAIGSLEADWDSYGSARPDSVSLHYAYAFLHLLRDKVNVSEPAITPNPTGNVCFEWDDGTFTLLVEIDAAGRCHYYYEKGSDEREGTERDFAPILQMVTSL